MNKQEKNNMGSMKKYFRRKLANPIDSENDYTSEKFFNARGPEEKFKL